MDSYFLILITYKDKFQIQIFKNWQKLSFILINCLQVEPEYMNCLFN